MMPTKRKFLLLFALPLLIPATLLLRRPAPAYSQKIEVGIGNFSSRIAGRRASLQRLAYELKRCPHAQNFSILRNNSGLKWWAEDENEQTFYDRQQGFLQDGFPLFGASTQWMKVTPQAIEKVAATAGDFNDFANYGAVYSMP